jgi:DNA-binding NarL/FixJ family response regulator
MKTQRKNFGLTTLELEIVSDVVAGYSNREIANHLEFGVDTVKRNLANIFDKLGVSSRLELAVFAVDNGLPPTETYPST